MLVHTAQAQTPVLPSGGQVTAGSATISSGANQLTINQSSNRAVIDWQSFSIGQNGAVNFNMPGSGSAVLNRVTGNTPSTIAGTLSGNGQVFLVNPNGIAITPSGAVKVGGGFVGSTLPISNSDFLAGILNFSGNSSGAVSNSGTISTERGGFVGLLSNDSVSNAGVISSPAGRVALGTGSAVTLDPSGTGFMQIMLPSTRSGTIDVPGAVRAYGGRIEIKAAAVERAVRNIVNVGGSLNVSSVRQNGGVIVLEGGNGNVGVSGRLAASSQKQGGSISVDGGNLAFADATIDARGKTGGGAVKIGNQTQAGKTASVKMDRTTIDVSSVDNVTTGNAATGTAATGNTATGKGGDISIMAGVITMKDTTLKADGVAGGGQILVGGDYQGTGPLPHAQNVSIADTSMSADALVSGNGGRVIIWSDKSTTVGASLTARALGKSGDGGLIETSSHGLLTLMNPKGDASAVAGRPGLWLLDPQDLVIDTAAAANISAALTNSNVTITTSPSCPLTSCGTWAAGTGSITLNAPITKTGATATTLTLIANEALSFNSSITASGGVLNLNVTARYTQGTGTFNTNGGVFTVNITSGSGSLYGVISGSGSFIKDGAGTLFLNGANTYTGSTTVKAGLLQFSRRALYQGDQAKWTAENIIVNSGAILGLNYGDFTSADIDIIKSLGTATGGFLSGSFLGLNTQAGSLTYSGSITNTNGGANALGLYKYGLNTLTLTGVNTFTGDINVTGGYVQIGGAGSLGGGNYGGKISIGASLGLTYSSSANQILSGVISGTGLLVKDTSSTSVLTLTGANTFVTPLVVNAGTLQIAGAGSLNGGNYAASISIASGATLQYSSSANQTLSGVISGAGNIIKDTSAVSKLTLSGANTYTGTTTVSAGTLQFAKVTSLYQGLSANWTEAKLIVASGATLAFNYGGTGEFTAANLDTLRSLGNSTGGFLSGSLFGIDTTSGSQTYSSVIANTNGGANALGIVKLGTNTLTLSGVNTYSGATIVSGGTLALPKAASLYQGLTSNWTAANITVNSGATLALSYGGTGEFTSAHLDILKSLGTATGGFQSGSFIGIDTTSGSQTYANAITDTNGGANSLGLVKLGGNILTLTGVQTYTGATTINGTLQISGTGSLGGGSYGGAIAINGATATLRYSSSANQTLSGVISGLLTNLTKDTSTTSTLTLTGTNTYIGYTTISAGTVVIGGAGTLSQGVNGNSITIASGATLRYSSSASETLYATINGAGSLIKDTDAASKLALNGTMNFSGTITIAAGTLQFGKLVSLYQGNPANWTAAKITVNSGATLAVNYGGTGEFTSAALDALRVLGTSTGGFRSGSSLGIDTSSGSQTYTSAIANTNSGANVINLVKLGANTLTLSGTNTYSGTTTVNAGTLQFAKTASLYQGVTSNWTDTNIIVNSGATLGVNYGGAGEFTSANIDTLKALGSATGGFKAGSSIGIDTSSGSQTYASAIGDTNGGANSLGLVKLGTNTLTLTATNTYSGATAVNGGTLQISGSGSLGSGNYAGAISLASGANLQYSSSASQILAGIISGAGNFIKDTSAASTLTLSGANTYSGTTTINAGTFALPGSLNVGSGTMTLNVGAGATLSAAGAITAGTLIASGAGAFNLTGGNLVGTLNTSGTIGAINFTNAQSLALGSISSTGAITISTTSGNLSLNNNAAVTSSASGNAITLLTAGNLTLGTGASVSGANPVLAAGGAFINNSGSSAVTATSGRWLIYSSAPAVNTFGSLDSGNTAIWNATYATLAPGSVSASGNRYLFTVQPRLTVTTTNASKTYGDDATANVASLYTISGYQAGVAGAFVGDTAASVFSGAPNVTSAGAAASASVAGGPYTVTASTGTLSALSGYDFYFANKGALTVTPATLTVNANAQSKVYGAADPSLTYNYSGLKNGDTSSVFSGGLNRAAGENVAAGPYAINQGTLSAGSNYIIAYNGAQLTITPATLTVTANAQSKVYGAADPSLTYNYSGLKNGDTSSVFSGGLTRAAGENVAAGPYAINQGTLSAGSNYIIAYNGAQLTITPATLNVVADNISKVFGAADPALTYRIHGLASWDNASVLSGSLARVAGEDPASGTYSIGRGSLSANSNYTMIFTGGAFTIKPASASGPQIPVLIIPPLVYNSGNAPVAPASGADAFASAPGQHSMARGSRRDHKTLANARSQDCRLGGAGCIVH